MSSSPPPVSTGEEADSFLNEQLELPKEVPAGNLNDALEPPSTFSTGAPSAAATTTGILKGSNLSHSTNDGTSSVRSSNLQIRFEDGDPVIVQQNSSSSPPEGLPEAGLPFKSPDSMDHTMKRSQAERLKHPESLESTGSKPRSWRMPGLLTPRRDGGGAHDELSEHDGSMGSEYNTRKAAKTSLLSRGFSKTSFALRSLTNVSTIAESGSSSKFDRTIIEESEQEGHQSKEDDDEETASEIAARKLQQRLKQAKKLENFFIKTDLPPRPILVRTKKVAGDWKFDANNDWLDRCSNRNFCTMPRPFFAAFHLAWLSFFCCFMGWFAVGPIVPLLLKSGFTKETIETSNALALASTIIIRFLLGPFCEEYGARVVMTVILAVGGVLVCATSGVTTASGLMASRFFIGLIGGAFVPCQFWISMMFSTKIVGFMSGSAAGFGNSGAGVIVFLMGGLIAQFEAAGYTADQTWRYCLLVPGLMMIACAVPTFFVPADCPQGAWKDKKYGTPADKIGRMAWLHRGGSRQMQLVLKMEQRLARARWSCTRVWLRIRLFLLTEEKLRAFWDWRAWMVGIQYSVASGVELSILTGLTAYYTFEFGCDGDTSKQLAEKTRFLNGTLNSTAESCLALDNASAAYIAAIFGMTNLYGRMLGGWMSDWIADTKGIFRGVRGRHLSVFITLLLQGVCMMIWCVLHNWEASAGFLVLFSSVVHMSKGAVIAIAPFVSPGCVGPVMGVVSAVGNLGGVLMSLMYSGFETSREVYYYQGAICIVGSLSAFMLKVHDLETNRDVWLMSRPYEKEVMDDDDDDLAGRKSRMGKFMSKSSKMMRRKKDVDEPLRTAPVANANDDDRLPVPAISFALDQAPSVEEEEVAKDKSSEPLSPAVASSSVVVI